MSIATSLIEAFNVVLAKNSELLSQEDVKNAKIDMLQKERRLLIDSFQASAATAGSEAGGLTLELQQIVKKKGDHLRY